jgi:LysM repeat protein
VNEDKNEAAQEFMEEIVDDLGYTPKGGKNQGSGSSVDQRPVLKFLIPGIIGIVLIIAVTVLFLIDRNGNSTEELATIQAGLTRLEERVTHLERLEKLEDRVVRLEKEEKQLQTQVQKFTSRRATSSVKTPAPMVRQRYHTVRSGESLYTIARKYGISTDKLCKLNNITPKKPIQPGQKLLVEG